MTDTITETEAMTETEICSSFRRAGRTAAQIKILTQLSSRDEVEIVGILIAHGYAIPDQIANKLVKQLSKLDTEISWREREFERIVAAFQGKTGGKDNGNRMEHHGCVKRTNSSCGC